MRYTLGDRIGLIMGIMIILGGLFMQFDDALKDRAMMNMILGVVILVSVDTRRTERFISQLLVSREERDRQLRAEKSA